jgi:hypothetical protein
MIPFILQPEPEAFDDLVRQPGLEFIEPLINAGVQITSRHFRNHDYWLRCRNDLKAAFNSLCAYSGFIVNGPGEVDHYKAKTLKPLLAYEWSNYRFASAEMNKKKPETEDYILDPFEVQPDWFIGFVHHMATINRSGLYRQLAVMPAAFRASVRW